MLVQRKLIALGSINMRTGEFKMDQQIFHVGDVVELNSGGPLMTVVTVHDNGNVDCYWQIQDGSRNMLTFHHATVTRRVPHHRSPSDGWHDNEVHPECVQIRRSGKRP